MTEDGFERVQQLFDLAVAVRGGERDAQAGGSRGDGRRTDGGHEHALPAQSRRGRERGVLSRLPRRG